MRIESTAITLRRREPWEAIDLGFAMLRQWWRPVYAAWALAFVPVAGVLMYAFRFEPAIAVVCLWWLKPVFDRIVLHVLSRAVFGEVIPAARVPADWREYLRPGLVAGQLWARVDLARSFDLPVWQLERVSGLAGGRRRALLQRRARYHAVWLTGTCAIFEAVLVLGLLLLTDLATPVKASTAWMYERLGSGFGEGWGMEATLAYAMAVTAIEPFYVAGGFSLYLNRRTLLEGWDIELELRRCAARFAHAGTRVAALTAAVLVALLSWTVLPRPAVAGEQVPGKSAGQEIVQVLKDPEFPHEREKWRWQVRWPEWEAPSWLRWPDWLSLKGGDGTAGSARTWGETLANLVKIAFWIAAIAALLWAIYYLARRLPYLVESPTGKADPPPMLFGLNIGPETFPADIAATAAQMLGEGQVREALSLLYRGALSSLVHANGIALRAGDTERECLCRASAVLPQESQTYFVDLIAAWEATAYAGRLPDAGHAQLLVSSWQAHFAPAAE